MKFHIIRYEDDISSLSSVDGGVAKRKIEEVAAEERIKEEGSKSGSHFMMLTSDSHVRMK